MFIFNMVLNNYRHLLPKYIDPAVNYFIKKDISPNTTSVMGFIIACLAAVTYAFPDIFLYNIWLAWVPPLLFFTSGYFDVLDGSIARKTGKESKFGGFFDSTLDRLSDAVVIMSLILGNLLYPWNGTINMLIGFTALVIMLMISYTRSRAELEGVVMKGIGFMERAERVFFILGIYLIEYTVYFIDAYIFERAHLPGVFPLLFFVFLLLCAQTLYKRVSFAYKWLEGKIPEIVAEMTAPTPEEPETSNSPEEEVQPPESSEDEQEISNAAEKDTIA